MSKIPVSKTKIIPPSRRPQLLTRKRLLEFMFEALDKKLTFVSAQAGYGKTSLLIDLIYNSDWKTCWLGLDEVDREPQRFAAYFIASIAEQLTEFGKQSKSILDNMNSFDQEMERLLVTLINELIENANEFLVIMLDDFHLVEDVQPIKNFINRFVQLMPENCHLVIASRKLTDFPELTLLIARNQASGLNFEELAFLPEELQALIAQNEGKHISDEEAKRLIAETEGWVTGLQFSNIKLPSAGDQPNLFKYFKQQVLDRQPLELREFILRTALFDEFDAKLCQATLAHLYSEGQDWQNWIRQISNNNVFVLMNENQKWIRYHHLFRDFIRGQFRNERPDEVKPILSKLQLAYEAVGEWEKAHYICKQLEDATALAEMIERAGTYMMQNSQVLIIESWLKDLPSTILYRPGILSIRGSIACLKGDFHESLKLLNEAEGKFRLENNVDGLALTLLRRAYTQRLIGNYESGFIDSNEVIDLTENSTTLKPLYAEALRVKGAMLVRMGQTRQSVHYFENSLQLYESLINERDSIPFLLSEIGAAYRTLGDYEKVKSSYEKSLQIWRQAGNIFLQANLLNNFGVFYHFLGQYEDAAFSFEEALLCARQSNGIRTEALIHISFGEMYAELEDFEMANQSYNHATEVIKTLSDRYLSNSLVFAKANLAFMQKNINFANQLIDSVRDSILTGNSNYEIGFLNLICGRLSIFEKKFDQAVKELEQAMRHFADDGRSVETEATQIWLAAALYQNKNSLEAIELINSLPTPRGKLSHASTVAGYQAKVWLSGLQNSSSPSRFVRELFTLVDKFSKQLSSIRRQVKRQTQVVTKLAPRIEIQAFGNPMVSIDGKTLTTSDWQTQAVRDLFFYFLTTNKPLTKEQIGELLWPEMYDRHKLNLRFKNEIYRLRKAVGQNVILYENDLYRFNHNLDYEYDVEAFEKFLDNAQKSKNTKQKIDFYQRAIDLVHGPYLNDVFSEWTIQKREYLGQIYLKALIELADLYQTDGQPERCIRIFEKIIVVDPGNEKAYQIAMKAYHRLQDRASIIRIYQTSKDITKKLFNLELLEETEELYRRLTK